MERGVIEGAEWINCLEDKKLGLHKVAKHYYTPGMHEPITGGQLMINKDVWKKLPPDLQEMIKVASRLRHDACATRPSTARPPRPARS